MIARDEIRTMKKEELEKKTIQDHGWDIAEKICRAGRRLKNGESGKKEVGGKVEGTKLERSKTYSVGKI